MTLRELINAQLDVLQRVMEEADRSDETIREIISLNHQMYGVLRRASPASGWGGIPMSGDSVYRLVLDDA